MLNNKKNILDKKDYTNTAFNTAFNTTVNTTVNSTLYNDMSIEELKEEIKEVKKELKGEKKKRRRRDNNKKKDYRRVRDTERKEVMEMLGNGDAVYYHSEKYIVTRDGRVFMQKEDSLLRLNTVVDKNSMEVIVPYFRRVDKYGQLIHCPETEFKKEETDSAHAMSVVLLPNVVKKVQDVKYCCYLKHIVATCFVPNPSSLRHVEVEDARCVEVKDARCVEVKDARCVEVKDARCVENISNCHTEGNVTIHANSLYWSKSMPKLERSKEVLDSKDFYMQFGYTYNIISKTDKQIELEEQLKELNKRLKMLQYQEKFAEIKEKKNYSTPNPPLEVADINYYSIKNVENFVINHLL